MKKIIMTCGLFFLFSFFTIIAFGQTVYYCEGCVRNGLCPVSRTFSTCEEARASGRLSCPGGGWRVDCDKKEDGPRFTSPISSGIGGGILGALGGSLMIDANGKNQWLTGAAGGFFLFSGLHLVASPKGRPLGVNIVFSALTFAAGGYATAKLIELNKKETAPATPDKKDNTAIITAGSAVLGALIGGFTFPRKSTKGGYSSLIRESNIFSKMAFTMSGNSIGIIVKL